MRKLFLLMLFCVSACQRSRAPEAGKSETTEAVSAAPARSPAETPTAAKAVGTTFSFDADPAGGPPKGLVFGRTGGGRPGRWIAQADGSAKSTPHVLAQLDADATNFRFPVAVTAQAQPANVVVSVNCKMISGQVDQACGLVLRYRDENNYLITRANSLEDNVRLYTVRDGKRTELASHDVEVTPNSWHAYRFEARDDVLRVFWDGALVLEHRDKTFVGAGAVGVWTKADSVTYFDDLVVEPL
jgi:hypothetical protein